MYIKAYKEEIIEGLQKSAGIIPQKAGAAYLRSIWLKADGETLEIFSTDSNIEFHGSYTSEVTKGGLIGVQGRAFVDLLRRLPDGQITLEQDEEASVLHIIQGRRKYKLPTNDTTWFQSFSDFPETGAVMWSGDFLQDLIDRLAFCIGDEGMDALACLIMKPTENGIIETAAMNGHQFAMVKFTHDELHALLPQEGILIPKKYLTEIKKWLGTDEIDINISEKRLFLRTGNKQEILSIPLASYQYPDYRAFLVRLSGEGNSLLSLQRNELQEALARIAIFNKETYFTLEASEAILSTSGQETGSATESLDVEYTGNINKIAFNTGNLSTIIDHFSSAKLQLTFTGEEGPCGLGGTEDKDYQVIIMPMKIQKDTQFSEEQV